MGKKQMTIGIDVDDVLADFWPAMLEWHNVQYGTALEKGHFRCYDSWKTWGGTREQAIEKIELFCQTDGFRDIEPVSGAQDFVAEFAPHYTFSIVTGRPEHLAEQTRAWLKRHFGEVFKAVHHTNAYVIGRRPGRKSDVLKILGADLFIEDHVDHALPCAEQGISVMLFDQPWNQEAPVHENMIRVSSWQEIAEEIRNLERIKKVTSMQRRMPCVKKGQ